tara:strand:+ start:12989 stop:16279 length:3291 start_codon:yes stop_codon:yes gene_type:complete
MIALQLYVEGQQVEMFDDETVTLSQSIQDVKAIDKIFTEFTQTFSIPASKVNNKIFKHFYNSDIVDNDDNPNVNSFDGRKKIDAELYLNYKPFKKGKIKLEGSTLKLNKPNTYRLTFFGNTVNLKDLLGDTKLSSLSFLSNFKFDYTDANLLSSITNGLDITSEGVLYDKAIVTPLMTYGQRLYYDSSAATSTTGELANLYYDSGSALGGVNASQLKPAMRVYAIVKAIESQYFKPAGFTFSDDFFSKNNASFYDLYIWLHNKVGGVFEDQINTVLFDNYTREGRGNDQEFGVLRYLKGGTFATVGHGNPRAKVSISTIGAVLKYSLLIYKDGELWKSFDDQVGTKIFDIGSFPPHESIHAELVTNEVGTFEILWNLRRDQEKLWSTTERYVFLKQSINTGSSKILQVANQLPDMKIIEFLQGLFKMFNLTSYITESKEVKIQALDDYYSNSEVYWDITKDLDKESSSIDTVLPYREINFTYEGLESFLAENHKEQFNKDWGSVKYTGDDKLSGDVYDITIPFEHFKYEKLIDANTSVPEDDRDTTIQYGWSVDSSQLPTLGKPLLFYPEKNTGTAIGYKPISGGVSSLSTYFIPSNSLHLFNEANGVDTSDNLNFNGERNEYTGEPFNKTLFEKYYSTYIKEVFDKRRRLTKIKAYLPVTTLHKLSLADKIVIFNKAYKINKINTNFETLLSNLELINISKDVGIIVPSKFLPDSTSDVTANTIFITADNSSFTADNQPNAEGLEVISTDEEIPNDTAVSNVITPTVAGVPIVVVAPVIGYLTPTVSTTTTVSLAMKIDALGKIGATEQVAEYGFFYSETESELTSNDIATLKANANVTNISIEYPISSAKYSIPEPLRYTVKGLTAPDFIYYKTYAITNNNPSYDSGVNITSTQTVKTFESPTYVGVEGYLKNYILPKSSSKRTIRIRNEDNTFYTFENVTFGTFSSSIIPYVVEGDPFTFVSESGTKQRTAGLTADQISTSFYDYEKSTGYHATDRSQAEAYAKQSGTNIGALPFGTWTFANRSSDSEPVVPLKEGFNLFKLPYNYLGSVDYELPLDGYYAFYNYNLDGTASSVSGISALVMNGVCSNIKIFY